MASEAEQFKAKPVRSRVSIWLRFWTRVHRHRRSSALSSNSSPNSMPALSVEFPDAVAHLHLCLGNKDAARTALLKGLQIPAYRDNVLGFVQKPGEAGIQSEYAESLRNAVKALAADPLILAEIAKVGRVIPFGVNEGAPAESP